MDDHLHPAIDIPCGGIWEGARITHRTDGDGLTIEEPAPDCLPGTVLCVLPGADMYPRVRLCEVADLSLRLDDPLGLGLAGLAARVAERAGISWSVTDGMEALGPHLARARWTPGHWFTVPKWRPAYRLAVAYADAVREAATLLARLDRLAAAVLNLPATPGVVPTWERHADAWVLTLGDRSWSVGCEDGPLPDNPIEAAGAALEVCGG